MAMESEWRWSQNGDGVDEFSTQSSEARHWVGDDNFGHALHQALELTCEPAYNSVESFPGTKVAADALLKSDISDNKRKALREHSIDNYISKNEKEMYDGKLQWPVFKPWFDKRDFKNVQVV
ncbi:hypothetical protein LTR72_006595 [Exophiala xenobiotica]|nr:hypothetical protein LTR72_006595 [Exophiala xenobiotica]KAK5287274.1 hypothetical protein LTR14_009338 [Exophiala xenobiotica]KAK5475391.1 hypothetical protein LTR55_009395 [Exophiala xenobiotica]